MFSPIVIPVGIITSFVEAIEAETITHKTYERMETLFKKGVVSEQKRDEGHEEYKAAKARANDAKSQ